MASEKMTRTTAIAKDEARPAPGPAETELFVEGDVLYAAMLTSIRNARIAIRLESYIFAGDEVGQSFAEALAERAQMGIGVRLHLDAEGARGGMSRSLLRMLCKRGVRVKWFHRWSWRHPMRYNRRNHRKLLVVDDQVAYVGGFNIHRASSRRLYGETRWRDSHVAISGPLVLQAGKLFDAFWRGERLAIPASGGSTGLAVNDTRKCGRYIRCLYLEAIATARERIYLTTPYFVPDLLMQQQLMQAARRGVDVRLLVPSRTDVPLTRWAAHDFYTALIGAGASIYEYLPRMMHAKTMTIDSKWAVLGTSNFDYRSFFL
ncbi:phospholipase D-like domain-containing protein [Pseudolysobacter antarcticus]|nr:phospholipase D-like domain-containing protein [Pseudolysobacter antarcticus]